MTTKRQTAINKALRDLIPQVPFADREEIIKAANKPHLKDVSPAIAVWLSVIAYIRHYYTDYDRLRDEGYDKDSARFFVLETTNVKLTQWRATRFLTKEDVF
ncbi:DUF2293 domain-containing protein [Bartonella tamiae]|uniref:DUF2293 domain-containing protein n=1 Tax=Bartonella tamiae Th239 TaxID=1094558 RepID=J0QT74_9HYPH|nr:DUF2293 domain-containing protein [Bartonella tamiae]EJF89081.1 hypothetical protein ME5_01632 [Bartonella tamiae Th239]EJF94669.1 hypothetical protein MEG_00250 [Bartonella tamiae Th307]